MVKALCLEVIAPTLQGMGLCAPCDLVLREANVDRPSAGTGPEEYPPDWQRDHRRLTDWVYELAGSYGPQLCIKVIDPQSPVGLLKSVRHRVRRYPTWLIGGTKIVGWDRAALEAAIDAARQGPGEET
ncbi:MAG TPA: hypothetical protein VLC52_02400 [Anaerolineae bacterium]|nr:hypothetical protein [Anaerolineae bacterium]